jgi:hypothetical protein
MILKKTAKSSPFTKFKQKNCVKMRHLDKHDVCLLSEAYFVLSHKSFLLFKNN